MSEMSACAAIELSDVQVRFGGLVALSGVSLSVRRGELVGIIGPNGAGKSTLFKVITGVRAPDAGDARVLGARVARGGPHKTIRRGVALAQQIEAAFKTMTVEENVALGAYFGRYARRRGDVQEVVDRVLQEVRVAAYRNRMVGSLNIPERKRVDLARCLASEPEVLLLDEIFAGLTEAVAEDVVDVVEGVNRRGVTVVVVEHLMGIVRRLPRRLVMLDNGHVVADGGPAEVLARPEVREAYLGKRS